ncbi:hypothetical protein CL65_gp014 [Mycobacterium phage Patience]|uniref:Uncharacterized protein n=1 Tax=Mycobacterium phage Patience TaxID=1074308 RepID=G1JWC4_9CAUD|nr:hypothetical protein CL65_gp014 [Mycobacterium phage Patience]AEL97922.1 hypothetical protein PATIENCE_13 [Mycobacterium phage Patience]
MTPRRKAALRKAQAASARARRRRVGKAAGLVAGTIAAGAVAYAAHRSIDNRKRTVQTRMRHVAGVRAAHRPKKYRGTKALVHLPGLGYTHSDPRKTVIPPGWGQAHFSAPKSIKTTPETIFKVSSTGTVSRTTKKRMIYDLNRRRQYWQAKPVGGAPRKKYTSKKRGRM